MKLKTAWEKYLKKYNVKLPIKGWKLKTLEYLYKNKGKWCTKEDIISGINYTGSDLQAPRHLGGKDGFNVISTHPKRPIKYKLINITEPYPNFNPDKYKQSITGWDNIKKKYNNVCATCGSKEGESVRSDPNKICHLQKGHIDPRKELTDDNCIPQCSVCNQAYQDEFIFDVNGRVRKPNPDSPRWKND